MSGTDEDKEVARQREGETERGERERDSLSLRINTHLLNQYSNVYITVPLEHVIHKHIQY